MSLTRNTRASKSVAPTLLKHLLTTLIVYKHTGWDIVACVAAFPARVELLIANVIILKDVTAARVSFPKPLFLYQPLSTFGPNIVGNNRLVWEESLNVTRDLIHTVWNDKDVVEVEHVINITLPIALHVIGITGFGRKMNWQADSIVPPGHTMSFHDTLRLVSTGLILKMVIPRWAMGLTRKWTETRIAFDELETYMLEMIRARRTSEKEERYDLFSSLLDANDEEDLLGGDTTLSDQELLGNFLFHCISTTAHTLAFAFALLALYPDQQEILYRHIKTTIPDGRNPTYEEMPLFAHSVAVFYETLRLFPPATVIPKISAEDTVLVSTNEAGERKTIPVPQGAIVRIDVVGLHHNPRYWKNPEMFDPSRFLGDWPREAFVPFSQGARACMGRKYVLKPLNDRLLMITHRFSETEGVAVLTMLISKYKITVREKPGETFEQRRDRILKTKFVLTLT
ncbi:cytochrome P450 [Armillaria borealis]|uniref:Cytochrome P450 n=1 Tax=Armillaria borealis TaxID=47425 RepID=A0AA39J9R0_9AGAR|nr:cytochrome P450 [Armillaria borealis]